MFRTGIGVCGSCKYLNIMFRPKIGKKCIICLAAFFNDKTAANFRFTSAFIGGLSLLTEFPNNDDIIAVLCVDRKGRFPHSRVCCNTP
jgi:hypothetical protein